jgi:hypothetical protein
VMESEPSGLEQCRAQLSQAHARIEQLRKEVAWLERMDTVRSDCAKAGHGRVRCVTCGQEWEPRREG